MDKYAPTRSVEAGGKTSMRHLNSIVANKDRNNNFKKRNVLDFVDKYKKGFDSTGERSPRRSILIN